MDTIEKQLIANYKGVYERVPEILISSPGRVELCGNHTDHQLGRAMAACIHLSTIGLAAKRQDDIVCIHSEGYPPFEVTLKDLSPKEGERETSAAFVRGIAAKLRQEGFRLGGFNAYITTDIPMGSGLSSSASFELLLAAFWNHLYNDGAISPLQLAKIGQFSENKYFGKPSGLMDQIAVSHGGISSIDFLDAANPSINTMHLDFEQEGYRLCVVNTGGSHAALTGEYAAVAQDMFNVAHHFGVETLRACDESAFLSALPALRCKLGDRAILRAIHFFEENKRVEQLEHAVKEQNMTGIIGIMGASGKSSLQSLQNIYSTKLPEEQGISLALTLAEQVLGSTGAARVHGGGFAGTIISLFPKELDCRFKERMEHIFGTQSVTTLNINQHGITHKHI